jgi:hypothetical protein
MQLPASRHAVRLTADEIQYVRDFIEDAVSMWDKHDQDSRSDAKRARAIVDKLSEIQQVQVAYVVFTRTLTGGTRTAFLSQEDAERCAQEKRDDPSVRYKMVKVVAMPLN